MPPVVQSPIRNMLEMVEVQAAGILGGCVASGLADEDGQPYSVQVRAIYADLEQVIPEITVEIRPGRARFERGGMQVLLDTTTNTVVRQIEFRDSRLILRCRERGDPERRYLLDLLLSSILAGYAAGPPVVEAAVLVQLGQVGIIPHGFEPVEYPPPSPDAARPEGQVFEAVLTLACDLALAWNTPAVSLPQGAAVATLTPS